MGSEASVMARMAQLACAVIGAIVLGLAALPQAKAQAVNDSSANSSPAKRDPAKAAHRPAKASTNVIPGNGNWTLNDALPAGSKAAVAKETPPAPGVDLGRLQLDTGSVGINTQTLMKEGEFSDGRRVPGLEVEKRSAPTFFGLSLSVPTADKSLIPVPLAPRPE